VCHFPRWHLRNSPWVRCILPWLKGFRRPSEWYWSRRENRNSNLAGGLEHGFYFSTYWEE
jgi:hypothetical protein